MDRQEKEMRYMQAVILMDYAFDILRKKAKKRGRYYQDSNFVKVACRAAYGSTLIALETYFILIGVPLQGKRNNQTYVNDIENRLAKIDSVLLKDFKHCFRFLNTSGYYTILLNCDIIRSGMDSAIHIINKIRPYGFQKLKLY